MDILFVFLIMIITAIIGRRSVTGGSILGTLAFFAILFFQDTSLKSFLIQALFGAAASIISSALGHVVLSGLKGGGHSSGPTYIGGGESYSGNGGIIYTDEELKNKKDNEKVIP